MLPQYSTTSRRVALLFPGQGSQKPGMGEPWLDTGHWKIVDRLAERCGRDVGRLLLDADAEELRRTDNAQIAMFAAEMMALDALFEAAPELPIVACAGHSLGEYAALVASGVLDLGDGGFVVAERGAAMADAAESMPGTMAVLMGVDDIAGIAEQLADQLGTHEGGGDGGPRQVWTANLNSPRQVVVSGTPEGVAALIAVAREKGAKISDIPVGGAFHTPMMLGARPRLAVALSEVTYRQGRWPVVANIDGLAYDGGRPEAWRDLAERQLSNPVQWEQSVRTLAAAPLSATDFVELGPGRVLAGLALRILPDDVSAVSLSSPDQVKSFAAQWAEDELGLAADAA